MKRKPRIAVVVPGLEQGGGVPSVAEFVCQNIEQSGEFALTLISLSQSARDDIGVGLANPASWVRGIKTDTGLWRGRAYTRIGAVASELELQRYQPRFPLTVALAECDLVQVVCGSPAWAWAVCGQGKPVAVQCATRVVIERRRRDASNGIKASWRRWMTSLTDRLERKVLQTADAVQVESPWMLAYTQELNVGRNTLVRYAPPGVDAMRFKPCRTRKFQVDPYVLCVGRLDDPRKNVGLLLEAYGRLPPELRATARLVLAGTAGPDALFWARAGELGVSERVAFISKPNDEALVSLYQGAAVFALPSDEEGLGVVILEAMACGVPVVSTRSGGPDGIISEGVDGNLVPLDDAAAMTHKLAQLLTDIRMNLRMGEAARQTILQRYEASVAGKAFLEHYEILLSRGRTKDRPCAG